MSLPLVLFTAQDRRKENVQTRQSLMRNKGNRRKGIAGVEECCIFAATTFRLAAGSQVEVKPKHSRTIDGPFGRMRSGSSQKT
jgi:hypothetical protein